MQTELLNGRWRTRGDLANATFEYMWASTTELDALRPELAESLQFEPPRQVRRLHRWEGWSHVREYVEEVPGRVA